MNSIISGFKGVRPSSKSFFAILLTTFILVAVPQNGITMESSVDSNGETGRTITAYVVALDQVITYNRFGSFNPNGMIYALARDVVDDRTGKPIDLKGEGENKPKAGSVSLRKNKRPRPLVLRVNAGDTLKIIFTNLLSPARRGADETGLKKICGIEGKIAEGVPESKKTFDEKYGKDAPATRCASIVVSGLTPVSRENETAVARRSVDMQYAGISGIPPGDSIEYLWAAEREGTYLFFSNAAPAGGEGDGGSLVHGLFGAVHVEPKGSYWYRSQVTEEAFDASKGLENDPKRKEINGYPVVNYEATYKENDPAHNIKGDDPVLRILNEKDEIIYGDLNAIIHCKEDNPACSKGNVQSEGNAQSSEGKASSFSGTSSGSFREFTVIFHDELKTIHPFDLLNDEPQLAGIRDGFGINYGASGLGTILLANRRGIGPSKDCIECFYEEFFLQSWVNGDPALLVEYPGDHCIELPEDVVQPTEENPFFKNNDEICKNSLTSSRPHVPFKDDPSNVHHSYLGDNVKFRNLHAGPKETHVFHLHAHQWLSQEDKGTYLDSQTIGPEQSFAYDIFYDGSGNRNLSPGDSIFHCHLYPHFAQGMWELWRVHDVLEDGSRTLLDGEITEGTPIPALVPMPRKAMAPLPTKEFPGFPFYIAGEVGHRAPQAPGDIFTKDEDKDSKTLKRHVIFGKKKDFPQGVKVRDTHENLEAGDFSVELHVAKIKILPEKGTELERNAMAFHALQAKGLNVVSNGKKKVGYKTKFPDSNDAIFKVNGLIPRPGAPFADPCPPPPGSASNETKTDGFLRDVSITGVSNEGDLDVGGKIGFDMLRLGSSFSNSKMPSGVFWWAGSESITQKVVRYDVSAIQIDMEVNRDKWHDPQARINVLDSKLGDYEWKEGKRPKGAPNPNAEPFFFRAHSGDCVTFYHTNRTPHILDVDDFQVKTPTDTIGQHIHLVKFDVTSSDGSANGWNYEDGTFARGAIIERIRAAKAEGGGFFDEKGVRLVKNDDPELNKIPEEPEPDEYQTTIQRWWADPLTGSEPNSEPDSEKKDHTIRTVFTHDHFAPSSIQQHGFYGALVIEPKGSVWLNPDGTPLVDDPKNPKAVGTRAIIQMGSDENGYKGTYREFMLAIADFALLYDPDPTVEKGRFHHEWGRPVDPPSRGPEAISTDHHNPYLVNYKHDPIPLRLKPNKNKSTGRGLPMNMANVFDSGVHTEYNFKDGILQDGGFGDDPISIRKTGDPFLKPFRAYEGDKIQLRVIQGAQEVQHTMTVHGLRWKRNIGGESSLYVNAQEVGISEHFEMDLPQIDNIEKGAATADYLFHFGSVDDLWNGAWGIIRAYSSPDVGDVASIPCREGRPEKECKPIKDSLKPLRNNEDGRVGNFLGEMVGKTCQDKVSIFPQRQVVVQAWMVKDLLPGTRAYYNKNEEIYSPNALVFIGKIGENGVDKETVKDEVKREIELYKNSGGKRRIEPMVLRANAGDCLIVSLTNNFEIDSVIEGDPENEKASMIIKQKPGEAGLPRITPQKADAFTASGLVSLHPQLLSYYVRDSDGAVVGYNSLGQIASPGGGEANYVWYAGTIKRIKNKKYKLGNQEPKYQIVGVPEEFGATNLTSFGDVIKHGTQGLVGALIIEPEGSVICSEDQVPRPDNCPSSATYGNSNLTAEIFTDETMTDHFREFVLIYQDGLNLYKDGEKILDCHICDDSYDLGEKAINYRTEPFWARLDMPFKNDCENEETGLDGLCDDTNEMVYPMDFFAESYKGKGVETTIFKVKRGHKVRFRVLQPAGRARQRSFQVYGHDYNDYGIPNFGSAHSSLISVGKGITAELCGGAKEGTWIYRDGPNFMFSGGAWGLFKVSSEDALYPAEKDNCSKK